METSRRWTTATVEKRVEEINPILRGSGATYESGGDRRGKVSIIAEH